MKPSNTFSKKDIIAASICFIFLLANFAAVGESGRKRAKEAVCLSNLLKWGQIFQAYTADNDGFFHKREVGSTTGWMRIWPYVYKPYYIDPIMRCCPTATNPNTYTGPYSCWGKGNYNQYGNWYPSPVLGENQDLFGSYGMNRWMENIQGGSYSSDPIYWRRADVKGGDNIPVFFDSLYVVIGGYNKYDPPKYNGDYDNGMKCACIERHSTGTTNVLFLDWSARKTGLKQLWTLKWNRSEIDSTCGPWTICGNGGDEAACAAKWDAAAPWMKDFPEY